MPQWIKRLLASAQFCLWVHDATAVLSRCICTTSGLQAVVWSVQLFEQYVIVNGGGGTLW
jgi:hypothetical protein